MGAFPEDLRLVLKALWAARAGPFHKLYVDLTHAWIGPWAAIRFDLPGIGNPSEAVLSVGTVVNTPSELSIAWSVSLRVVDDRMIVTGLVEVDEFSRSGRDDRATREVFHVTTDAATAEEAAKLIRQRSEEVCAQRAWIGYGGAS